MAANFEDSLPGLLDQAESVMVELRHDLHAHPELSFHETRTTRVIRDRLGALGLELRPCPTDTGAVAVLHGGRPGRRVMLRADIDALPVTEERPLAYASVNPGVMHACGHDVHTAALLGVADVLSRRRDELAGDFLFLFQPAEEGPGGALVMIEGGVMEDNPVDAVIGAHVVSLLDVGFVATRPGIIMSSSITLDVTIEGRGGHGAMPTTEGNVILALSELAPRLGEVVAGLAYEGTDCACSAGVLRAGSAKNVTPRRAQLSGTLRTFTAEQRVVAEGRLRHLLAEIERAFEVTCRLDLIDGTPAVANDPEVAHRVMDVARRIVGDGQVFAIPPVSPSDDVSEFLARAPGCYLFVGGALADGTSGMHHGPDFAVDDGALRVMAGVLAAAAVDLAQG